MALQQTHHQYATQPSDTDSHYHLKPMFNKFNQQIGLLYPNVTDTWRKGVSSEVTFSFPSQPGNQYHYRKPPDNTTSCTTCFGTLINFVTLIGVFPHLFHREIHHRSLATSSAPPWFTKTSTLINRCTQEPQQF